MSTPLPYPVTENSDGFSFKASHGIKYSVVFSPGKNEFIGQSFVNDCYEVTLLSDKKPSVHPFFGRWRDPQLEPTIMGRFADLYLRSNLPVFYFSCDLADGLERHRSIIFGSWYYIYLYPINVSRITVRNRTERIYAAVWYHRDNPYRIDIEEAFKHEFRGK